MTMFLSNFSSNNFFNGNYFGGHFGPVSDFNQLQTYTLANLSNYVDGYKTASDSDPAQFSTIERITAGYLMNTMDFGKWHIVAGVRFEGTKMNALGYNVTLYPAGSKNCPTATGCGVPVPVRTTPTLYGYSAQHLGALWTYHRFRIALRLWPRRIAPGRLSAGSLCDRGRFDQSRDYRAGEHKSEARACQ